MDQYNKTFQSNSTIPPIQLYEANVPQTLFENVRTDNRMNSCKMGNFNPLNGPWDIQRSQPSSSVPNEFQNQSSIIVKNEPSPLINEQQNNQGNFSIQQEDNKQDIFNPNLYTSIYFGNLNSSGDDFDDYQTFARNLINEHFQVEIFRLKIYSNGDSIVGIKPVYKVADKNGKNQQTIYKEHRGSKYSWIFSKRLHVVLEKEEKIIALSGYYSESINQICVHTNLKQYSVGKKNGNHFQINPGNSFRLLAIGGTIKETLTKICGFFIQ